MWDFWQVWWYTYWGILAEKNTSAIHRERILACYVSLSVGVAVGVWNLVLPNGKKSCGQEEWLAENRRDKTLHDVYPYSWLKL